MFPIVAVSWEHSVLAANVVRRLAERLDGTPCRAVVSPLRVRVSSSKFVYPDVAVICGVPTLTDEVQDTITNPKVVVEILSPSTADYDYGEKFVLYRQLPSFEEYLLIAQDQPRVEVYCKAADRSWVLNTYDRLDDTIELKSLQITIALSDIYAGIDLAQR
jgi:Uma2 family endonuclease